jgi:hypothetical protein
MFLLCVNYLFFNWGKLVTQISARHISTKQHLYETTDPKFSFVS